MCDKLDWRSVGNDTHSEQYARRYRLWIEVVFECA